MMEKEEIKIFYISTYVRIYYLRICFLFYLTVRNIYVVLYVYVLYDNSNEGNSLKLHMVRMRIGLKDIQINMLFL